jgi:hypothetical protein
VYEVLSPLYGNPSSPRVLYKTKDVFFKSEGFYTVMTSFKQDLKTFGMWDCSPVKKPLDANNRLSKSDCPEVVDPIVHRRYRSIVGCLSYLVNMTRPDLVFTYSQMNKFVQYPGMFHLEVAELVLQYVRATHDQGISYDDLGPDKRNKLGGWVYSDFDNDIDSRSL